MQLDTFNRVIDEFHAKAEAAFSDLEIPAASVPLGVGFKPEHRIACDPAGPIGVMAFVNALGEVSQAFEVNSQVVYRNHGTPGDEDLEEEARAFAAVAVLLSLPVVLNLGRVVCADPVRLLASAYPDTDPTRHPGVVTVLAYSSPKPQMPFERVSLVGGGRSTRIEPDGSALPVPPPAGRWLRLLLP